MLKAAHCFPQAATAQRHEVIQRANQLREHVELLDVLLVLAFEKCVQLKEPWSLDVEVDQVGLRIQLIHRGGHGHKGSSEAFGAPATSGAHIWWSLRHHRHPQGLGQTGQLRPNHLNATQHERPSTANAV